MKRFLEEHEGTIKNVQQHSRTNKEANMQKAVQENNFTGAMTGEMSAPEKSEDV